MLGKVLLIALGGACGAVCRHGVYVLAVKLTGEPARFPLHTLAVNVAGCFLIGLVMHYGVTNRHLSPEVVAVIVVGFLGAFTTFSSFGYETLFLWEEARAGLAVVNVLANVALGLLATCGGLWLARAIWP